MRKFRCISYKPVYSRTCNIDIISKENFSLGEALQSVFPLLGLVFEYLSYEDLLKVTLVNSWWKSEAEKVLNKRKKLISWLTIYNTNLCAKSALLDMSKNFLFYGAQYCIILRNFKYVKLSHSICLHDENPKDNNHSVRKLKFSDFFKNIIPKSISFGEIFCSYVDSSYPKLCIEPESRLSYIDICLIPYIPNVKVVTSNTLPSKFGENEFNLTNFQTLKCLLTFSFSDIDTDSNECIKFIESYNLQCAFGGGFVSEPIKFRDSLPKDCLSIAFIEDTKFDNNSHFDAASIVIKYEDRFEETLTKFKRGIVIREHSLAFRFICIARSGIVEETKIFNKLFPNTIHYGIRVNGEIGWDTYKQKGKDCNKKRKKAFQITHQLSSAIVFLTWGNVLN